MVWKSQNNYMNKECHSIQLKAFGLYRNEYGDQPDQLDASFKVHVNNLKTRAEVLQWYLDLNTGGVVHTDEEIEKVKQLLNVQAVIDHNQEVATIITIYKNII